MASFYLQGAFILDQLALKSNSLKALINTSQEKNGGGNKNDQSNKRRILALCANTLAYKDALEEVIERAGLLQGKGASVALSKGGAASVSSSTKGSGTERPSKKQKTDDPSHHIPHSNVPSARSLLLVLLYDMLMSSASASPSTTKRKTSGIQTSISYPPTAFLLSQKARLHSELVRLQLRRGAATIADLRSDGKERQKAARIPRWVRLNTARFVNQDEARDEWEQWLHETGLTPHSETEDWLNEPKTYVASRHVSNVYALHTSITSQVISSEWYQSGKIILQDLASCFPAQILASYYVRHFAIENREGSQPKCLHAVDATAAPGNKTSHLSTLLDALARPSKLNVTVSAFEKDKPRFRTLVNLLGKVGALASASTAPPKPPLLSPRAGAFNVQCFHEDFLSTDSKGDERWKDVQMMMLDPSCSGSGILGRLDHLTNHSESEVEQETDENDGSGSNSRLESLAKFQLTMIKHAMSFPALRCFTYSTCSVHEEENEQVVANALALPQARESGWRLAGREDVLPAWPQRGVKGVAGVDADALVRAAPGGAAGVQKSSCHDPHVEATNGFFVCLFVRDPPATATPASLSNKKKNKKKKKKKRGGGLGKADDSGNAGEANDEAEASDQDE